MKGARWQERTVCVLETEVLRVNGRGDSDERDQRSDGSEGKTVVDVQTSRIGIRKG